MTATMWGTERGGQQVDEIRMGQLDLASLAKDNPGSRKALIKNLRVIANARQLVAEQYSGRYPFELLQNADDAGVSGNSSRCSVRFEVTRQALLVANRGSVFQLEDVQSICSLGNSRKDPQKSIGHKGLGFKSVHEITDTPQIISGAFAFQFDGPRALGDVKSRLSVTGQTSLLVPMYHFPFRLERQHIGEDAESVDGLLSDGFSTVIRLPFKPGVTQEQVSQHVRETLSASTLLFLRATSELSVHDAQGQWRAAIRKSRAGGARAAAERRLVLTETDRPSQRFSVFSATVRVKNRELLKPLGEGWATVRTVTVSAAFSTELPTERRLHVYFPTEERLPLPFLVHADFPLSMDRRHLDPRSTSQPFISWIAEELMQRVTKKWLLAWRRACPDVRVMMRSILPCEGSSEFGDTLHVQYLDGISTHQPKVIPTMAGRFVSPEAARLLPYDDKTTRATREFCHLNSDRRLVAKELEGRHFTSRLRTALQIEDLSLREMLSRLRPPGDLRRAKAFFRWVEHTLDGWRESRDLMASCPVVLTTEGKWVAPTETNVFLPPLKGAPVLPKALKIRIASTRYCTRRFLQKLGVPEFKWRPLLRARILPVLKQPGGRLRAAALQTVGLYLEQTGGGDQDLRREFGAVVLKARDADGGLRSVRKASALYFGSDWGCPNVEAVYGPLGEAEFLAERPPGDVGALEDQRRLFAWLGVEQRPRLLGGARRHLGRWSRAPDAADRDVFKKWAADCKRACPCTEHPERMYASHAKHIDRFGDVVASLDHARARQLLQCLLDGWNEYSAAMQAVVSCSHGWHASNVPRAVVQSLVAAELQSHVWFPGTRRKQAELHRPTSVWRLADDLPRLAIKRLPVVELEDTPQAASFANALGLIDNGRPPPKALADVLRTLESDLTAVRSAKTNGVGPDTKAVDKEERSIARVARWALRRLNDAMRRTSNAKLGRVPLPATRNGEFVLVEKPFRARKPHIRRAFADLPLLDPTDDYLQIRQHFALEELDEAQLEANYGVDDLELTRRGNGRLDDVRADLGAYYIGSRETPQLAKLRDVRIQVHASMTVTATWRGETRPVPDLSVHTELVKGRLFEATQATLHCVPKRGEIDWYVVGDQLARLVDAPTLADGFALLLREVDPSQRWRFLAAKGVEHLRGQAVEEFGDTLVDDTDEIMSHIFRAAPGASAEPAPPPTKPAKQPRQSNQGKAQPEPRSPPERRKPPPIVRVKVEHVATYLRAAARRQRQPRGPDFFERLPSSGPRPDNAAKQESGDRGEEAVMLYERQRVELAGGDVSKVVWHAQEAPLAPYDVRSVDEEGNEVHIEVKATSGKDPTADIHISPEELLHASEWGTRYWLYRVTESLSAEPTVYPYRHFVELIRSKKAAVSTDTFRVTLPSPQGGGGT